MKFLKSFLLLGLAAAPVAQAHTTYYTVVLNGASESPVNSSLGTGTALVTLDMDLVNVRVQVSFTGLGGTVTAAHIHGPTLNPFTGTAGVMTPTPSFPGFPSGVTSGSYDNTIDLTQASGYNPTFVTANGSVSNALNAFETALESGRAYLNIHTSTFGGGEIRGFLVPVPEPGSSAALMLGAAMLIVRRRR
jgi:hypothetical protein